MSYDIEYRVDVVRMVQIGNKAERFGIRHGTGKCRSKASDTRKLYNTSLLMSIWPKVLDIVIERSLHRGEHSRDVPGMFLQVINFQFDAIPLLSSNFIPARDEAGKIH